VPLVDFGSIKNTCVWLEIIAKPIANSCRIIEKRDLSDAHQQCCILCSNGIETFKHLEFNRQLDGLESCWVGG